MTDPRTVDNSDHQVADGNVTQEQAATLENIRSLEQGATNKGLADRVSNLKLQWKEVQNLCPANNRIEGPCGASAAESTVYFRKYWGKSILSYNMATNDWKSECSCEIDDTTLVMLPIEFGGEEALHTIGGKRDDGSLVADLYYYKDGSWKKSDYPPMDFRRKQVGAVCYQKKYLVVVGGLTEYAPEKIVEVLDLEKKEWSRAPDISFENCDLQQVYSMNEIALLSHLAMYDTEPISDLLDKLDYAKGRDIEKVVDGLIESLELYMPKLDEALHKELKQKREILEKALLKQLGLYRMSLCFLGDDLYILGGFTNLFGQSPLRTVFKAKMSTLLINCNPRSIIAPVRKTYTSVKHVPYGRSTFVTFRDRILAIGGSRPLRNNKCVGEVYEYLPGVDEWVLLEGTLCTDRCHCVAVTFRQESSDKKLMVFGGRPNNHDSPSTDSVEVAEIFEHADPIRSTSVAESRLSFRGLTASAVLKKSDLLDVLEKLYPAAKNWYYLGLSLGMSDDTLASITGDDKDCLRVMLSQRLSVTPVLTYSKICECLRKKIVDRHDVADNIERLYI